MPYKTVDAAALKPLPGPHPAASPHDKDIGQALGIRAFGLYQVELPPGGESVRHGHADDGAEDVSAIVHGSGTIVVDGEQVLVRPGQFIAVTPDLARPVRASDSAWCSSPSADSTGLTPTGTARKIIVPLTCH